MPKIMGSLNEGIWMIDFSVRMDSLDTVVVGYSDMEENEINFYQIYNYEWAV